MHAKQTAEVVHVFSPFPNMYVSFTKQTPSLGDWIFDQARKF